MAGARLRSQVNRTSGSTRAPLPCEPRRLSGRLAGVQSEEEVDGGSARRWGGCRVESPQCGNALGDRRGETWANRCERAAALRIAATGDPVPRPAKPSGRRHPVPRRHPHHLTQPNASRSGDGTRPRPARCSGIASDFDPTPLGQESAAPFGPSGAERQRVGDLAQARRLLVTRAEQRFCDLPVDGDVGVVPGDAGLGAGVVVAGDLVGDVGFV